MLVKGACSSPNHSPNQDRLLATYQQENIFESHLNIFSTKMCSKIGCRLLQAVLFAQQEDYFSWDKQFKRIWVYLHVSGRAWHDRPWIFVIRWRHHNETSCWTSSPVAGELFTSSLRAKKRQGRRQSRFDLYESRSLVIYNWLEASM